MALVGNIIPGVGDTVDGLLGVSGPTGSVSGSGSASVGLGGLSGLLNPITGGSGGGLLSGVNTTGLLDGLVNVNLLDEQALLKLGILPDDNGSNLLSVAVLDRDGDGLVDVGLLNDGINASLLDRDGDGLIDVNLLDTINLGLDISGDLDNNGIPDNSTDPGDFDIVLMGTGGSDQFVLDASQSYFVEGMGGTDQVSYGTSASGFNYAVQANGVFISNGDKVDYLQNVERVAFSDGTLHLDTGIGETAGYAYRIYQAAFDRAPDAAGLDYWIDVLDSGAKGMTQVAADFLSSREFQQTYGALSTQDFIEELYENILQRSGEDAGIDYWTDQLDAGVQSRAQVLAGFSDSAENVALVGATIDNGFFLAA
ncbi:DUF4214 domain-containing protein [Tianweitania sp. BSSL-BM11]|uniref:DUF4214 domain-containing protein n=1 Tax=Tianweitania aestuarii TaxID=2814886 RepID=A0ABS5RZ92_9HYPH|nr:DUF4214 domain-containing protein [Tianweitania aestuarii]MBS9722373.1 DUF4214 domain-containing protein [Tianweitania aestuarii]